MPLPSAWPLFAASVLHVLKGDWAEALSRIERWLAVARTGPFLFHLPWGIASSAWPLAQRGEASEALNRIRESEQLLDRLAAGGLRRQSRLALSARWRGPACCSAGATRRSVSASARWNLVRHQPGFEAHALHLLGDVAAYPDQFDAERGETHYRQALALAERLGMRPLVAHCHLGLSKRLPAYGPREQAQEHAATATTMYREMGMTHWLQQAEAKP